LPASWPARLFDLTVFASLLRSALLSPLPTPERIVAIPDTITDTYDYFEYFSKHATSGR
jgi:hypothetical protein